MEERKRRKIKRYFTKADYEAGLCDENGCAIPGGPEEPKKRAVTDSVPTPAQKALAPDVPVGVIGGGEHGKEAVDPLTLDPPMAEEGFSQEDKED